MKTKLVLMGTDAEDKKVLVAMQLMVADNKVKIWTFPESLATPELEDKMMTDWRNDKEVELPEGFTLVEKELSVTDNLLPEDIKTERTDLVMRAQTEWAFIVLSTKMSSMFESELSDLKDKVKSLDKYDSAVWNDLKNFWGKVQSQVRERNLFREHADSLRDNTNALFNDMKEMRKSMDEEFRSASKEISATILGSIKAVEDKVEGNGRLNVLFEDLKNIQKQFKDARLSKDDRSTIWERLDAAFKVVKEKRFGPQAGNDSNPVDRVSRRLSGLNNALEKMQRSIQRDRDDLEFQNRRIDRADNQLEAQIRVAKIRMIEERIRSKEEKLKDMVSTQEQLNKKVVNIKDRAAKDEAAAKAKAAKKEQIAKEVEASKANVSEEDAAILEKAAEKIKAEKSKDRGKKAAATVAAVATTAVAAEAIASTPAEKIAEPVAETVVEEVAEGDSAMEAVGTMVNEGIEDAVDTIKAIAAVVGGKIEEAVVTLKKDIEEATKEVEQKAAAKAKASSEEEE